MCNAGYYNRRILQSLTAIFEIDQFVEEQEILSGQYN